MQKKPNQVLLELEAISEKRRMVLNSIDNYLPNQQHEFLLYMAKEADPISNYDDLATIDLVDLFIEFEEDNNEEGLTSETMDGILRIYVDMLNEEKCK